MHTFIRIVAQYFIILPVLITVMAWFALGSKDKRVEFVITLVGGGLVSLAMASLLGHVFYDPRPFVVGHFQPLIAHANDNGFPSDHTLLASFLGWTVLRYSKKLGITALVIAAMIGLARMAAGVHHSWDIIGSFVISGVAVLIVAKAVAYTGWPKSRHFPE